MADNWLMVQAHNHITIQLSHQYLVGQTSQVDS